MMMWDELMRKQYTKGNKNEQYGKILSKHYKQSYNKVFNSSIIRDDLTPIPLNKKAYSHWSI